MLTFLVSLLAVCGFILTFAYLNVVPVSREAIVRTQKGVFAIFDSSLSEDEREIAVQSAGLSLLKTSFEILWRVTACLFAAVTPIFLVDYAGLVPANVVTALMLRWEYVLGTTLGLGGIYWLLTHSRRKNLPQSAYSDIDQITHKLAFSGARVQMVAADIEDRLFANQIREIRDQPPVFITSLPRAGTTILLTALNEVPGMASHLYRDMPFVMAPLLWSRLSGKFVKDDELSERAHGDGISIGYDSPEAFEEIIWQAFWPGKYLDESIKLWCVKDEIPCATEFFLRHFRKVVALRANGLGRYISKNNSNIARLDLLPRMFPSSSIVVPLREPAEHAASMLRQHNNFLKQHAADPFVQHYMRDVGHLEFGKLHKPFCFPSFQPGTGSPEDADYWLDYWISAYELVLEKIDRLHLVSHEKLGKFPETVMLELCERINIDPAGTNFAKNIRTIEKKAELGSFAPKKLAKATDIYHTLLMHQV